MSKTFTKGFEADRDLLAAHPTSGKKDSVVVASHLEISVPPC